MTASDNPLATAGQAELELEAVELARDPVLQDLRERVRQEWLDAVRPGAEMRRCFDGAFEEVMHCALIWALNQDGQHPRVLTASRLGHLLGGTPIPGSRYGLDNPDAVCRVIPIDGVARYLLHGRVSACRPSANTFALWDHRFDTIAVFDGSELVTAPDGSFTISIDEGPADGRVNHIRSSPEARELYVRDVLMDWEHETPNALAVQRLGEARRAPRSRAEKIALARHFMREYPMNTQRWNAQAYLGPANVFEYSVDRVTDGAVPNQVYRLGNFRLDDDEALVLTLHIAEAECFGVAITNVWGTTNEIVHRTGSLNRAQTLPNPDGSYTLVLSVADPGVHNWLDPDGLHEGVVTTRWAGFPGGRPSGRLELKSRCVRLADLGAALPAGTRMLDAAGRREQLLRRARGYRRRLNP